MYGLNLVELDYAGKRMSQTWPCVALWKRISNILGHIWLTILSETLTEESVLKNTHFLPLITKLLVIYLMITLTSHNAANNPNMYL